MPTATIQACRRRSLLLKTSRKALLNRGRECASCESSSRGPSLAIAAAHPADAADRNFGVSGFDRVRVDGPYKVRLITGVASFATARGSAAALDSVAMDVQGRTLIVRSNRSSWGGYPGEATGPVEITIGTHELTAAYVNGAGSLAIDKVRGCRSTFRSSARRSQHRTWPRSTSSRSPSPEPAAPASPEPRRS